MQSERGQKDGSGPGQAALEFWARDVLSVGGGGVNDEKGWMILGCLDRCGCFFYFVSLSGLDQNCGRLECARHVLVVLAV